MGEFNEFMACGNLSFLSIIPLMRSASLSGFNLPSLEGFMLSLSAAFNNSLSIRYQLSGWSRICHIIAMEYYSTTCGCSDPCESDPDTTVQCNLEVQYV